MADHPDVRSLRFRWSMDSITRMFPWYYGWVVLAVGALGVLASIPGQTMGVSVFTDHYINALDVTRVGLSSAYLIGTLCSSLIIPYAGIFYDTYGARITASLAVVALSVFLCLLAVSGEAAAWLVSMTGISRRVITIGILILGFFGIRFFGQGVLTIVSRGMVARWFGPRRGIAVGIMGLVTSFGFSYAPQPLHELIARYGWRGALVVLSGLLSLAFLPIVLLFFRSDPDSCGLRMEQGSRVKKAKRARSVYGDANDKTLIEAKREPRFWRILLSLGFWGLFNTAFTFHIVSIFAEIGESADQAVSIFLPISMVSVVARFSGSYVSDRISIKYLYVLYIGALMLASVSFIWMQVPYVRVLMILSYGMGSGLFGMLTIVTWPKLYGRGHIGAISGFAMSIIIAGSPIGPWSLSMVSRFTHTYQGMGLIGLIFTGMLCTALLVCSFLETRENLA